jgi:hypothetical protein
LAPEIPLVAQAAVDNQNKFLKNTNRKNTLQAAFSDEKMTENQI